MAHYIGDNEFGPHQEFALGAWNGSPRGGEWILTVGWQTASLVQLQDL